MKKQEFIQRKTQMTAYDRQVVNEMFHSTIEWFEKYVEVAYKNEFPDWENRKQIHNNSIKRVDIYEQPKKAEKTLSSQLHLFAVTLEEDASVEFEKELKREFYKWISATGIDVNNCPERLKHFIFGLNEIFEGNYEKIRNDIANRQREIEMDSPEYMEKLSQLFTTIQAPMRKGAKLEKSLEGKNPDEIEVSRFNRGNLEQGEQVFKGIAKNIAGSHENFYFKEQTSSGGGGSPPSEDDLDKVAQAVKRYPKNWRLDEITTELGDFNEAKQEWLLIRWDARLDDYDQQGKLNFKNNPIYRWESFNVQQRFEIKKALNISVDYLTEEEIKWTIREFKDNPNVWGIRKIDGQFYLVHNSAQIRNDENGTLIHRKQKFSDSDWEGIGGILGINWGLVVNIEKNAKLEEKVCVKNLQTGEVSENEDWFIHNQLERKLDDKTGYLIFVPNAMIRAKDLSEGEQEAVGYKSEQLQQVQVSQRENRPRGGGSGKVVPYIWGSLAIISLIGLAFVK